MPKIKRHSGERFGKLILQSLAGNPPKIYDYWLCLCDCGNQIRVLTTNLLNGNTQSCGCKRSEVKKGHLNPQWKGELVGYGGVHDWVRKRYPKPTLCEHCALEPPRDLANKTNTYQRDLTDWWYLCRRCHMELDGRSDELRRSGRARRGLPRSKWKEASNNG